MIFKSYLLEQNISQIEKNKLFLFYGENEGLKKEFKKKLKTKYNTFEVLNYFQEEIIKDKNLINKEIESKSLFNIEKLIFIEQSNDKLLEIIEEISNKIKEEKIFIFAGLLDKRSKLRSFFEKSKDCGISACYADNDITIKKIIFEKLKGFEGLNNKIVNTILQNTGLDRNKVDNEIQKIISCFHNKCLNLEEINSLLNLNINENFNILKDEALKGNKINTNKLLSNTIFEKENIIYYINSINQRINKLCEIEREKKKQNNIEFIINNIKPPVFWKDRSILAEQSKKWNFKKLKKALKKTFDTELEIKSNSSTRKDLLIKNLIVELCVDANSF
tara:strand:- start:16 stop:1014 length:999 start_codon:yes stop_codon:yes gene_type:complete